MKKGKINERLSVGAAPSEAELRGLRAEGFGAVIDMRRETESNQPLDLAAEGKAAAAAGLKYFHIPVDSSDPKREQVEAVRTALSQAPGPVYAHCQGGGRACAMALLGSAPASGYGSKELMAQAQAAGFPVKSVMADFVRAVLDRKG